MSKTKTEFERVRNVNVSISRAPFFGGINCEDCDVHHKSFMFLPGQNELILHSLSSGTYFRDVII